MNSDLVTNIFALLLLITAAVTVVGLIVPSLRPLVREAGPYAAAAVAIGATLGSLYLSEVVHWTPCRLCWYQRIGMYPIALIIPIALFTKDRGFRKYVFPLAVIGILISTYHVYVQLVPEADTCGTDGGCAVPFVWALGFMTIPRMAWVSFALIITFLIASRPTSAAAEVEAD